MMHRIGRTTRIGLFLALCGVATIVACESGPGNLLPNDTPDAGSDSNGGDATVGTAGNSDPNAPSVTAARAVTFQDTPVTITLAGSDPQGNDLSFAMMAQPAHGTLDAVENADPQSATVSYTPDSGFTGNDSFLFRATDGSSNSDTASVTIVVFPTVVFTVDPLEAARPLNVVASAATLDGSPLPTATYQWSFGDLTEAGPVESHASRSHTFARPGVYTIALSLALSPGGPSISCTSPQSGALSVMVTARPTVSGHVYDASGAAVSGVTVAGNNGASTAVTDAGGLYEIDAPFNWTGVVTPQHVEYSFAPGNRSHADVTDDVADQDFVATHEAVTLSGHVRDAAGSGIAGVTLSADNGGGAATTDAQGLYALLVPFPWSGTLTPTHADYTFSPPSRAASTGGNAPLGAEDFVATHVPVSISGRIVDANGNGVASITVSAGNAGGSTVTDSQGGFALSLPYAWSGIVAPTHPGYIFSPASRSHGSVVSALSNDDFLATPVNGPAIAGTITLVATVGARPKIGPQRLAFTGTGAWTGADYTVVTDVEGVYLQAVPDGWTGTIAAAEPNRCFLTPESRSYDAPVTGPQLGQDFTAWVPPIGIPAPDFGITETHYMYAGQRFDFNGNGVLESGEEYPDAGNGPYTHYIDNTHPDATDNGNPFGTPDRPRLTMLKGLTAGSVVEIHGGPYDSIPVQTNWIGTMQRPIFVRGVGMPRFSGDFAIYNTIGVRNGYVIVDGLSLYVVVVGEGSHHIVLRNCDQYSGVLHPRTGVAITPGDSFVAEGFVIFNNVIHDNGIWDPTVAVGDRDFLGMQVGWNSLVKNVWIIDNDVFHNEGDAIHINAHPLRSPSNVDNIYIGRNKAHDNKQVGIALKSCDNVIVSQNDVYGHRPSSSATGAGMGFSDAGPAACWFLYNRIHDNALGFKLSESWGVGGPHCLIGNVIYDIHGGSSPLPVEWGGPGQAVADYHSSPDKYIIANTIYDTDYGYCIWGVNWDHPIIFSNNIFSQLAISGAPMILIDDKGTSGVATVTRSLFDGDFRIQWGPTNYTSLSSFQAATGQGVGCLAGDASFSDPAQADFQLRADSPAVDAGVIEDVYDMFLNRYGIEIRVDIERMPIPVDGNGDGSAVVDIGAYEYRP